MLDNSETRRKRQSLMDNTLWLIVLVAVFGIGVLTKLSQVINLLNEIRDTVREKNLSTT